MRSRPTVYHFCWLSNKQSAGMAVGSVCLSVCMSLWLRTISKKWHRAGQLKLVHVYVWQSPWGWYDFKVKGQGQGQGHWGYKAYLESLKLHSVR